jgi:hypothetical protein
MCTDFYELYLISWFSDALKVVILYVFKSDFEDTSSPQDVQELNVWSTHYTSIVKWQWNVDLKEETDVSRNVLQEM